MQVTFMCIFITAYGTAGKQPVVIYIHGISVVDNEPSKPKLMSHWSISSVKDNDLLWHSGTQHKHPRSEHYSLVKKSGIIWNWSWNRSSKLTKLGISIRMINWSLS